VVCRHNYQYTQGHFYCTKCGKRTYGRSYKNKHFRKIGIAITGVVLVGIVGFLFINGVFEINPEKLQESIQNIPKNIPELPPNIPPIPVEISKPIENIMEKSAEKFNQVNTEIQDLSKPQQSTETQAVSTIEYVNKLREQNGKNPISHDSRVFQLALARTKDMYDYNYLDHTNPQTGTCPYNMKSNFGLQSNENVAENAYLSTINGKPSLYNPSLNEVVDGWMESTGHRMNLLSYEHIGGSVACYGGYCVFLGLNHGNYGEGCYTAVEGKKYAARFDACTSEQMSQYDSLNQRYDSLSQEYEKFPQMSRSQAEYQNAMKMYDELQNLYSQIENFKC